MRVDSDADSYKASPERPYTKRTMYLNDSRNSYPIFNVGTLREYIISMTCFLCNIVIYPTYTRDFHGGYLWKYWDVKVYIPPFLLVLTLHPHAFVRPKYDQFIINIYIFYLPTHHGYTEYVN